MSFVCTGETRQVGSVGWAEAIRPESVESGGSGCREGTTMNGNEVLRIVDAIHRDKNIDKEIVFEGIAQAILSAAKKHYGEEVPLDVQIDRESGQPTVL